MLDVAFDMETSDPDDVFTLCFLATHPRVNLRCVTVTPGSRHQIGLVRHVLALLAATAIPIGSRRVDHPKECVSEFHYSWLGARERIGPAEPDGVGAEILAAAIGKYPELTLVTGASLGNVSAALALLPPDVVLKNIFIQGGFAGDSVVPAEYRLSKFEGLETSPTFNLNGDVPAAKALLIPASDDNISNVYSKVARRHLISKNVCHGVVYDAAMHERMMRVVTNPTPGFALMREGMAHYLSKHPSGKAFHDPLAACTAIDESICTFREVEVYRAKGEWGSRLAAGTNTFISVHYDRGAFERVLAAAPIHPVSGEGI